uniref:Serine-threonine/tyrosine-protein kinase catalytic domain-containing protein n=1 Tax=Ananas comosus var. bracteatus TaxID=296719 RepID=A0A6V7Q929_ANACO|nr:unnamed protein product [Ananas comosus var. bracteatus]
MMRGFVAEIASIGRLRHRHLVRLFGYCRRKGELFLVYELVPNGTLDKLLFCDAPPPPPLDWARRVRIVRGVASALFYCTKGGRRWWCTETSKRERVAGRGDERETGDFGLSRLYDRGGGDGDGDEGAQAQAHARRTRWGRWGTWRRSSRGREWRAPRATCTRSGCSSSRSRAGGGRSRRRSRRGRGAGAESGGLGAGVLEPRGDSRGGGSEVGDRRGWGGGGGGGEGVEIRVDVRAPRCDGAAEDWEGDAVPGGIVAETKTTTTTTTTTTESLLHGR